MKLTREEHPESIRRFAHLRRGRGSTLCAMASPGERFACTREKRHHGPHAAHGWFGRVMAVWDSDALAVAPPEPRRPERDGGRSVRRTRRPVGLPTKSSAGIVEELRALAVRLFSSFDQIAFVLLFVVFVWFAIEVLLRLY